MGRAGMLRQGPGTSLLEERATSLRATWGAAAEGSGGSGPPAAARAVQAAARSRGRGRPGVARSECSASPAGGARPRGPAPRRGSSQPRPERPQPAGPRPRWGSSVGLAGRGRREEGRSAMEAEPAPDFSRMLRELLAPPCLDPEPPPAPPARQDPRPPGRLGPSGRSFWPARGDSVSALHFLQETAEGLAQPPPADQPALGPCWELKALGTLGPPSPPRDAWKVLTPISPQCCSLGSPGAPPAPPATPERRPRKQPHPQRGAEKADPRFQGVTLTFEIKPDCSLHITPSFSPACSSRHQPPPTGPARGPEASSGGSEALGPRRCASCRTQRTPLWRDAEDGTPLCNACGIRYKKYGTRCASCWLVPRKNVQPKRLCGRCGVSLSPHPGPTQES
ncbi:GATA-type zinc finger protein 1 [Equus caballus]|uniref:Zinc finger GATA like protein 1 n=1 Tax=Equus caballus TaxID=9796 RepID=A0A3Q2LGH2_HORSE|nr:GATA-type zinc finger protein 1 isoform X2 [Equus caballus]